MTRAQELDYTIESYPISMRILEARTIEYIPLTERHGRARDMFTVWFGGNLGSLPIATGAITCLAYHLPFYAAMLALVFGNIIGGFVMALHAAQGPQMGVPQMVQTRAQFGSIGSLFIIILIVFMYSGFFASNMILGSQALHTITNSVSIPWGIIITGLGSSLLCTIGYKLIHSFTRFLSVCAGIGLLIALGWIFCSHSLPSTTFHTGTITFAGLASAFSLAALWQIAYAPYVSDYTRYMPENTGVQSALWATFSGCVISSSFCMSLGALVGAALPQQANINQALSHLVGSYSPFLMILFFICCLPFSAINLYCAILCALTALQTIFSNFKPQAKSRIVMTFTLLVLSMSAALLGHDSFMHQYESFLTVLMCVLVPWTAVNLVDYYLLRHGNYHIPSLFDKAGGVYGKFNIPALSCYIIGIIIQLPFMVTNMYIGFIAHKLHNVDISWIVGLLIIAPLYYLWVKGFHLPSMRRNISLINEN